MCLLKEEIEGRHTAEVEDGRVTNFLLGRLMLVDLACTLLYVIGLCFGLIAVFIYIY